MTPGAANDGSSAPLQVFINEWMASNTGVILDPADNDDDDWFELYNPGENPADLGGYFLTDNLLNPFQFEVPDNGHYVIPPHGYLLVWADGETGQNSTNRTDLHVNFSLRQSGEAIGLFAGDGTAIDTVTFGPQTENISQGRFPDGTEFIFDMSLPTPRVANVLMDDPDAPEIMNLMLTPDGTLSFSFATELGRVYRVDYKNDLNDGIWMPLTLSINGTGDPIVIQEDTSVQPKRFYRVVIE